MGGSTSASPTYARWPSVDGEAMKRQRLQRPFLDVDEDPPESDTFVPEHSPAESDLPDSESDSESVADSGVWYDEDDDAPPMFPDFSCDRLGDTPSSALSDLGDPFDDADDARVDDPLDATREGSGSARAPPSPSDGSIPLPEAPIEASTSPPPVDAISTQNRSIEPSPSQLPTRCCMMVVGGDGALSQCRTYEILENNQKFYYLRQVRGVAELAFHDNIGITPDNVRVCSMHYQQTLHDKLHDFKVDMTTAWVDRLRCAVCNCLRVVYLGNEACRHPGADFQYACVFARRQPVRDGTILKDAVPNGRYVCMDCLLRKGAHVRSQPAGNGAPVTPARASATRTPMSDPLPSRYTPSALAQTARSAPASPLPTPPTPTSLFTDLSCPAQARAAGVALGQAIMKFFDTATSATLRQLHKGPSRDKFEEALPEFLTSFLDGMAGASSDSRGPSRIGELLAPLMLRHVYNGQRYWLLDSLSHLNDMPNVHYSLSLLLYEYGVLGYHPAGMARARTISQENALALVRAPLPDGVYVATVDNFDFMARTHGSRSAYQGARMDAHITFACLFPLHDGVPLCPSSSLSCNWDDGEMFTLAAIADFSADMLKEVSQCATAEAFLTRIWSSTGVRNRPHAGAPSVCVPVMEPVTSPAAMRKALDRLHQRAGRPRHLVVVGDEPVWLAMMRLKKDSSKSFAWLVPMPGAHTVVFYIYCIICIYALYYTSICLLSFGLISHIRTKILAWSDQSQPSLRLTKCSVTLVSVLVVCIQMFSDV